MRLAGINDLAAANAFLPGYVAGHNTRFAVVPEDEDDAHVPYAGDALGLARICAIPHRRKLSKDLVLSFNRQRYILQTGSQPRYALRGESVTVVVYPDQRIELLHGKEVLPYKVFDPAQAVSLPVDDKTLNVRVEEILRQRRWSEKSRPPANHTWRRYPEPLPSGAGQLASP